MDNFNIYELRFTFTIDELLITVPGKPPLCLKCKMTGHFRRACHTPYCSHHNEYGHTAESCALKKATYANVVRNNSVIAETAQSETEEPTAAGTEWTEGVAPTGRQRTTSLQMFLMARCTRAIQ